MTWQKPPVDAAAVRQLSTRYDLDLLTAAILVRRDVSDPSELPYYLERDLRYLHSPFLFEDMPDVVERVLQAADEEERVFVFGDRDVDGITSTAVMVRTLRELGLDPLWEVPEGDAPYGLTLEAVERAAAADVTLIITVDCGITSGPEIEAAAERGIDTIVIDHHNAQESLPPAVAIINPKVGEYPFQGLCACAVVAKVRQAIAYGRTDLFGQHVALVNARPVNDAVVVDAVLLENGIEVERVSEALVPGVARLHTSRLAPFLVGNQLVCYDEPAQQRLLREGLGTGVDIYLTDLATEVRALFPAMAGRSLLEMREKSRLARYTEGMPDEVDVLVALYGAVADARVTTPAQALDDVLDMVALATLADMMPIRGENRPMVRRGLERLNSDPQPGLGVLLAELGLTGQAVASRDVSWKVTPAINATGRMGTPSEAVRLFLTEDGGERRTLAATVKQRNVERRRVGDDAWRTVLAAAEESRERFGGSLLAVHDPSVHRGVTGLIAGRLSRRFDLPAAVVTTIDGTAVGSVRSARGFVATDFLQRFEDIFDKWGGHDQAAGFNLPEDRLGEFWERLTALAPQITLTAETEEELMVDAELPAAYLTPALGDLVRRLEPYGQGYPEIRFLARAMVVEDLSIIGRDQDHVRLLLAGGGHKFPAVWWGAAPRLTATCRKGDRVDLVFEVSHNYFNGNVTLQFVVQDLKRSEEQIVEE